MANHICEVLVTEDRLRTAADNFAAATQAEFGAGAVTDFWGMVRPLEDGRKIEGIDYEAHREMAEHQLKRISEHAAEKFGCYLVIIHHRVGFVAVGEPSLFLRVTSSHRAEAFRATQWIVDELKKKVPIWKRPKFIPDVVAGVGDASSSARPNQPASNRPASSGANRAA
jgi:molybdopterin synthase catalytic subunit